RRGLRDRDRLGMRQTVKTATGILGVLRGLHQSLLGCEDFFLIVLPRLGRATIPGYFGLEFSQPIRNRVPGGLGKNRLLQLVCPDLVSHHATAIEEKRGQTHTEEQPTQQHDGHPWTARWRFRGRHAEGGVGRLPGGPQLLYCRDDVFFPSGLGSKLLVDLILKNRPECDALLLGEFPPPGGEETK